MQKENHKKKYKQSINKENKQASPTFATGLVFKLFKGPEEGRDQRWALETGVTNGQTEAFQTDGAQIEFESLSAFESWIKMNSIQNQSLS